MEARYTLWETRLCEIATEDCPEIGNLTMQVCDVHKPLLSIGKMVRAGRKVVFESEDSGGSYIQNKETGHKMALTPDGTLWKLKAWVRKRQPDDSGQHFQGRQSPP